MLEGRPTVFLSCSEAFKPTVGRLVAADLASNGVHGVLVSDAPLLIGDDASPDGKVERYLDVADAFIALCTPDDRLRSGQVHCRLNIIDEIQRARQKPHLRNRIMIFKDALVTLPSNLGLAYTPFDASSISGLAGAIWQQLNAWQVVGTKTDEAQRDNAASTNIGAAGAGGHVARGYRGLFAILADPVVLEIIRLLLDKPQTQKALSVELGFASSTISRRMRTLEDIGLVLRDRPRGACYLPFADETRRALVATADLSTRIIMHHVELADADLRELRRAMLRQVPDTSAEADTSAG